MKAIELTEEIETKKPNNMLKGWLFMAFGGLACIGGLKANEYVNAQWSKFLAHQVEIRIDQTLNGKQFALDSKKEKEVGNMSTSDMRLALGRLSMQLDSCQSTMSTLHDMTEAAQ